jgi:4-amino-4-deoxy-L-arabinose transferase-like glycosyltransferase
MRASRTLLLLALLAALPALAAIGSRSFFSPDEANYAQVAREMAQTGDLLVPHRDGAVWLNKPPLAFWLLAGAFAAIGWGLPAAIALNALLTLGTAVLVAHRAGGLRTASGRMAGVVYLTAFLPVMVAQSAMTDAALVALTTAAVVLFLERGRGTAILSGAAFGLAILAKGPVAPLVVVPALAAAALAAPERKRVAARAGTVVLTGLAVVAPWVAAVAARGLLPQLVGQFLGQEVLARAVDAWNIAEPFWFYLPLLWLMAFPWGTHLLLASRGMSERERGPWWRRPDTAAEAAAVVVPVLAFSLARNKLPHYLLPIMPWLACWLGRAFGARRPSRPARADRAVAAGALVVGPMALLAVAWFSQRLAPAGVLPAWSFALLGAVAATLAGLAALELLGNTRVAAPGLAALGIATVLALDLGIIPHLERQRIDRPVAEATSRELPSGGIPIAHDRWRSAYLAYGPRGWVCTSTREELASALRDARAAGRSPLVVTSADAEGDVRAVAAGLGVGAVQVFRFIGLSEERFRIDEVAGFRLATGTGAERWFYDCDHVLPGDAGLWGPEGHRFVSSYRWTNALVAELPVKLSSDVASILRLRARGLPLHGTPQTLTVALGDRPLGSLTLRESYEVFALPVPASCLARPPLVLKLRCAHMVRPIDELPGSHDTRQLGVAVDWIALDPATPTTRLVALGH